MAHISRLALMGLAFGVTAACADAAPAGQASGGASPSSSSDAPLSQNPPPSSLPTGSSRGPTDQLKPLTVRGIVEDGRETGCLELVTSTSRFVLLGEPSHDVRAGDRVEVTGMPAPQRRTACDGIVLLAHRVRQL